jgi:hypothetical protein
MNYRKMVETPEQFAVDLIRRVCLHRPPLPKLIRHDRAEATKAIATILRLMATQRGYKFHPWKLRKRREFLLDFVWLRWQRSHPMHLKDLELVAECEWIHRSGGRHILYDFQKLLPLKARFKLFVYMIPPGAQPGVQKNMVENIHAVIQGYERNLPGESFFLLQLDRKRKAERATIHYLTVPSTGVSNFSFSQTITQPIDCP